MKKNRIIIVGGGFAGVKCAQVLSKKLSAERAEIILFNSENHLVFSPLLAEVVGSSINPMDVIVPLRQLLPRVFCRTEEVRTIQTGTRQISFEAEDGQLTQMEYDHLVIACGNITNLNVVPGMADHAFPLKTVGDATTLRSHIMEQMEKAEVCQTPERRAWHLTFIVVGGGFSGAEVAGEINDLVQSSARYFKGFTRGDVKVRLIHSRDELLPEISPPLRAFARRKMEKAGVEILLNARVNQATPDGVALEGGQFIKGGTTICTIGNSIAPMLEKIEAPKDKNRLLTDPDMRVKGLPNVWAIGDCGLIINALDQKPAPTTGQFAEREGSQCAENIIRVMNQQPTRPFCFKQIGELCSIGGHAAVADIMGMHLSGFLAWFMWRGIYLFKLPTWARRFQVGFDWAWLLLFPRDLAHVRTRQSDRVSQAHYQPGDVIIQQGEIPANFYVIKQGEVEVVRSQGNNGKGEVVSVLGQGSFFGEKALINNEPRVASVRARTAVEVLVLGKDVFTRMSAALAPLRDALAQTLNRRGVDIWKDRPEIFSLLHGTPLKNLMEPVPQPLLKPELPLREVGRAFVEHSNEFFYVSADGQTIDGVVTITDLLRARSNDATEETPVQDFMTRNPVVLCQDDDCAIAASAFREYRMKSLPVVERKDNRKLVGSLRIRRLMAFVLGKTSNPAAPPDSPKTSA